MSYPYRCTREKCKQRRSLRRRLEQYVRVPKCKVCGSPLRLDRSMQEERKRLRCFCDGYPFPHRSGSLFCKHYAGGKPPFSYYEKDRPEASQWLQARNLGASDLAKSLVLDGDIVLSKGHTDEVPF